MGLPRSCYQRMKFLLHYQEERRGKGPYLSTDYRGNPPRKVSTQPTRLCCALIPVPSRRAATRKLKGTTIQRREGGSKNIEEIEYNGPSF